MLLTLYSIKILKILFPMWVGKKFNQIVSMLVHPACFVALIPPDCMLCKQSKYVAAEVNAEVRAGRSGTSRVGLKQECNAMRSNNGRSDQTRRESASDPFERETQSVSTHFIGFDDGDLVKSFMLGNFENMTSSYSQRLHFC